MPTPTTYQYNTQNDTLSGIALAPRLAQEIHVDGNIITDFTDLYVSGLGIFVDMKGALSSDEENSLRHRIAQHYGIDDIEEDIISVDIGVAKTEAGALYSTPQIATTGNQMCDRDIKLVTSTLDDSFEDLKPVLSQIMGPHSYKRVEWEEVSLSAVYAKDGGDNYVACANQLDASTSGVLSVWDFQCHDQTPSKNLIAWDIAGGGIKIDGNLSGNPWDHQLYVIGAPNIPASMGGQVRFFDGYLACDTGSEISTENPEAKKLDPALSPEASKFRIMLYYPAGAKQTHVLRLRTYRPPGTF